MTVITSLRGSSGKSQCIHPAAKTSKKILAKLLVATAPCCVASWTLAKLFKQKNHFATGQVGQALRSHHYMLPQKLNFLERKNGRGERKIHLASKIQI